MPYFGVSTDSIFVESEEREEEEVGVYGKTLLAVSSQLTGRSIYKLKREEEEE